MTGLRARAVVIGATGYAGRELVALLAAHPDIELVGLFASSKHAATGSLRTFADEFPRYRGVVDLHIEPTNVEAITERSPEVVFLATPAEVSCELVSKLRDHVGVLVDLSAAFRIPDATTCERWYSIKHTDTALLDSAAYGLVEHARDSLFEADLIAAPGCYPTAALLGLLPLAQAGALEANEPVSIVGISGVSGAGRSATTGQLFCEVSLKPYAITGHRHTPEIEHHLGLSALFTPHVGPWDRGMVVTSHAKLADGWDAARVNETFELAYPTHMNPFVRLLTDGQCPNVAAVERTNFCDLAWHVESEHRKIVVTSAIDNLLKGAAGQAVQAMNLRLGFEESAGLLPDRKPERIAIGGEA